MRPVCLTCGESAIKQFYKTEAMTHRLTKYLHNCKQCCKKKYDQYYAEYNNHKYCIYLMCRMYNYPYEESLAGKVEENYLEKEKKAYPFSLYLQQIKRELSNKSNNATSFDEWRMDYESPKPVVKADEFIVTEDMRDKWGDNYESDDYKFLEREYEEFSENIIIDKGIDVLIMEACYASLQLRKTRANEHVDSSKIKDLTKTIQDLVKNLGMDAKSKVERDNGKLINSLGMSVADYEEFDAVDKLGKLKTLENINNIDGYLYDYVYRPTRNNVLDSSNFDLRKTQEDEDFNYLGDDHGKL